jgi:hypothetical protein
VIPLSWPRDGMVGRFYLERGRLVLLLCRWGPGGPRNVAILRESGEVVVRPFRGLRRLPEGWTS